MNLYYIPKSEIDRYSDDLETLATIFRFNCLYMIQQAGSGHIGGSFSCMDILVYLYYKEMKEDDVFILSKGHAAPALYSVLIGKGIIPFEDIHKLRRLGGLPGHPHNSTPGISAHTGSLGMGISKAKGIAIAKQLNGDSGRVFVLVGDGEMQEGQNDEAIRNLGDLPVYVIVDFNGLQTEGKTKWHGPFTGFRNYIPGINIIPTIKAKGLFFLEAKPESHAKTLNEDEYTVAINEFKGMLPKGIYFFEVDKIKYESIENSTLIQIYGDELLYIAWNNPDVIVLDADLMSDHCLNEFKREFPDRFIECGISEQDMVSTAGGLALAGKIPICHSFACFLSSRANEQIYNNCCEGDKVIYIGSMSGWLSKNGGPGISHECNRDKYLMMGMPNLKVLEPKTIEEVRMAIRWAVYENEHSTYIRICKNPMIEGILQNEN